MRFLKNKKLIASVLVVAAIVAVALWPQSMEVAVVRAERGPMQVTVDEDGETRVRDLNRELDWLLPEDEAMTVAGLLTAASRGLPRRGEVVEIAGYRLEASDLRGRRVARVRIVAPSVEVPED